MVCIVMVSTLKSDCLHVCMDFIMHVVVCMSVVADENANLRYLSKQTEQKARLQIAQLFSLT